MCFFKRQEMKSERDRERESDTLGQEVLVLNCAWVGVCVRVKGSKRKR